MMKKPNSKGYTAYGILEKEKLQKQKTDQWLSGLGVGKGVHYKRDVKELSEVMEIFSYLD